MDKVFLTVLNMSLTGAFVIAAICLARLPLKKAPKIISYCLWAVAGFRLICPFSLEGVFSLIPWGAQPIPETQLLNESVSFGSAASAAYHAIGDAANGGLGTVTVYIGSTADGYPITTQAYHSQVWLLFLPYVWIVGVAILLIYGVVSFVILKRKMRKSTHVEANVYEAENIKSPFVLGVFNPRIYLPVGLSEQEKSYIILHEQTHIKRHDHIVKFAAYFVLCLHWFNPLAWVAFLLMGVDMEMSCDERVLKEMGGETKKDYSLSLLSLATERRVIGGSPLAFSEGGLKARIKNVLNFKKPSRVIIVTAVALVAVLSVGFSVNRVTNGHTLILRDLNLDFTNIEITNTTSEWGVRTLNVERTDALCQMLWDMQFVKNAKYSGQFDSMFRLKFLFGSEEVEEIYVLSNNSIVYKGNIYKVSDGFIDLGFIENLYLSYDVIGDDGQSWDRRPMIFVDGSIYMDTNEEVAVKTDSITISGTILSSVDGSEMPTENGQSNFGYIGSDYAHYENGVIVKINDKWVFFVAESRSETTSYNDDVTDPIEMSGATQYMNALFSEFTNPIDDSRITIFKKTGEFNGITSNTITVWQLEFDFLPVDPDAFNRVSDVRMESDGWVTESEVSRVFLVFSYDKGALTYLGAIPRYRHDLYFPLYERQGQEAALQIFIDELTNPPVQDYKPLRGYLTDFNVSDMTFMFKEISWLTTAEDNDVLIEQGINPGELPNGFYIKEYPNIAPVMFQFNINTEFRVIDYVEYNGQHRTISANDFSEFIQEREIEGISTLCIIEWDKEVISVSEQYLP